MTANDFKHTMKALNDFGQFIVDNYKSQLETEHMNNGELYKTISYSVSTVNSGWVISVSLADYWKYIEDGRWPYGEKPQKQEGEAATKKNKYPPLDVIENWIKVRNIIPHSMTLKSGKTVIPTIPQLSFLIARSISQRGIPPKPLFKKSFEAAKKQFIEVIKEAITQDIKENLI